VRTSNRRYPLSIVLLLAAALLLATQPLAASGLLPGQLDLLSSMLDQPPHLSVLFLSVVSGILLLAAAAIYTRALNPYAERRPLVWVWLNAFAPFLFAALGVMANDLHGVGIVGWKTGAGWGLALLFPTLLLLVEQMLFGIFRRIGDTARLRGWRRTALRGYKASLRLRPARPALLKLCGLLHREEDDCPQAIALLERLGPVERSEDDQVLHALEQCYRVEGYIQDALNCLLRLRQLRLDTPGLDRKILDDQVKLGHYAEALELIESGRLKQNFALLMIRQNLHTRLAHYDQASELAGRIAELEGPPFAHAERLYRELMKLQPEFVPPRIALGQLLLSHQELERRQEGADLLTASMHAQPDQLDLAQALYDYYRDNGEPEKDRPYLEMLIAAGTAGPDLYLELARRLTDEGQLPAAEEILRKFIEHHPADWRGHLRLGRLLFTVDRLDEADAALTQAGALAPEDAEPSLNHLRNDLDHRRRELRLACMVEAAASYQSAAESEGVDATAQEAEFQHRLRYLDELIALSRIESALRHAEQMLTDHPQHRAIVEEHISQATEAVEQNFRLLDYLSDLYLEDGKYDELLALYHRMSDRSLHPEQVMREGCEKILSRAPDHIEARLELALAHRQAQNWAGVIEALDPLMGADTPGVEPADKALWVEAAFRLDRLDDAIARGMELAAHLAAEPGFMLLLIDVLQAADRHQEAYDVYQRAREAAPDDPRLARLARRVTTNRRKQRLDQLVERFNGDGLTPAEHYEKAELHRAMGQVGEAIVHYQRAADQEQLAVLALAKMAVSLSDKGMYDLAEEILSPLVLTREMDTTHPELKDLFYSVARSLEKIKRPDLAMKYYKRIFHVDAAFRDIVDRLERLGS
jgi:Flp pilus assembly protein TadD